MTKNKKRSYIDDQSLAEGFEVGDSVKFPIPTRGNAYSPYPGKVVTVLSNIGMLDVATSMGTLRVNAHEVVKDGGQDVSYLEDIESETWDKAKYRDDDGSYTYHHPKVAQKHYNNRIRPLAKKARKFLKKGFSEKKVSNRLSQRHVGPYTEEDIQNGMRVASINSRQQKTSLYWKDKGRQYIPTRYEWEKGHFDCPHCREKLTPKKYKHDNSEMKDKLYICNRCLWMIRPEDMIDRDRLTEEQEKILEKDLEEDGSVDHFEEQDPVLEDMIE